MRRSIALSFLLLLVAAATLAAHDLFLKPASFFVAPNSDVDVRVLNGTFTKSESPVTKDRLRDISIVTPGGRSQLDTSAWRDRGDTSVLAFRTGAPGTYVVGASTLPRAIRLTAKQFNDYLASDGVPDVLDARRGAGELEKPAHERYSKHVKTLLQVGDSRGGAFDTALGYPAELVPLDNPYALKAGDMLRVRALVDGRPVANQFVVAGGRTPSGARIRVREVRSDSVGVARVALGVRGHWYVKFIHMASATGDSVTHESKWASLTFQIR
jgi:uncharacterized GH25 family protein